MRSMKRIGIHIVKAVNIKTVFSRLLGTQVLHCASTRRRLALSTAMGGIDIEHVVGEYVDDHIDVSTEASHGSMEGKWCNGFAKGKSTANTRLGGPFRTWAP